MTAILALGATVSFAAPADVASRLLPRLGAAMGLRLEADRRAGGEVLLVRASGMDQGALLRRVAQATGGAWERLDGGYRLVLGGAERAALQQEEAHRRAAWMGAAKAEVARKGGEKALLARALDALPIDLARLRPGERIVWSSAPTALQRTLPDSAFALGRELAAREGRRVVELLREGNVQIEPEYLDEMGQPVEIVLVSARRGLESALVSVALRAYGAGGKSRASTGGELSPPEALALAVSDAPLKLPEGLTEWARAAREGSAPEGMAKALLRPDEAEPLGLGVGPAVEVLAVALGKDVVAALPDAAYAPVAFGLKDARRLPDLARALARAGIDLRPDGDALLGAPAHPSAAVERRMDRRELARLLRSRAENGGFGVGDLVGPGLLWPVLRTLTTVNESEEENALGTTPFKRLWAGLTPLQRAAAFGDGLLLETVGPRYSEALREGFVRPWAEADWRDLSPQLAIEPTFAFGETRLAGRLRARLQEEPVVLVQRPGTALVIEEKAWALANLIRTDAAYRGPAARYWNGTRRTLHLAASQGSGATAMTYSVALNEVRRVGAAMVYPSLPEPLRREIGRRKAGGDRL